ncbi:MAG TPA: aldose 1-epimerase, partial [Candidatus Binataceae bacterium]|nr:aldose 1-epimerase [Candidatus Binataceae bacterium]
AGPPSPAAWRDHPFRSGIPILFPWPGRVANAHFTYREREVRLGVNEAIRGHAIHGLTWNYSFKIVSRGPYFLRTQLSSSDYSELANSWPWRFTFTLDHEVGNGLRVRATVRNDGDSTMPLGLGAHPYFAVPLSARGTRGAMQVHVPKMQSQWPLDAKLIPAGPPIALSGKDDLREQRALGTSSYDDAFHLDPHRDPALPVARVIDPAAKLAIELRADAPFGEFVLYAPPDRDVVSLEPYTCAPDAFNLAARGVASGMRELAPGDTFAAGFEIRVSSP